MLRYVKTRNVGPASRMNAEFGPRVNLFTGGNGTGKSFILDVAWWAASGTWARHELRPRAPVLAEILSGRFNSNLRGLSRFDQRDQVWESDIAVTSSIVMYAQEAGGFSVWVPFSRKAYLFQPREVWEGNDLCEGLVRDVASWQREGGESLMMFSNVIKTLSPTLELGGLQKISIDDPKRYPTLKMPVHRHFGESVHTDVAVVHASSAARRVIALAYLLVWA